MILSRVGTTKLIALAREMREAKARGVVMGRILRKYGYPPDKQEKATQTVLEQAEVLSVEWITA